jgi:hypothetical protein
MRVVYRLDPVRVRNREQIGTNPNIVTILLMVLIELKIAVGIALHSLSSIPELRPSIVC